MLGFALLEHRAYEFGLLVVDEGHCLWAKCEVVGLLDVYRKLVSELMEVEMVDCWEVVA